MTETEYALFLEACRAELLEKISASHQRWDLPKFSRFDFDQDKGELTFSEGLSSPVVSQVQIVGSFSTTTQNWEWAWNNPYVDERLRTDSLAVKVFGSRHGIQRLTLPEWSGTESHAWDMTAIAAHVCAAEGAYRMPNEEILIFMLLKQMKKSLTHEPGYNRTGA